jgi:hypothetical protein
MGKQQDNLHKTSPRQTIFMMLAYALMSVKPLCKTHCLHAGSYFIYQALHRNTERSWN